MTLSKRAKDGWSALGAVLATAASLWIIGVGFYLVMPLFTVVGFVFLLLTGLGIMIYLLKGTTWRT